MTESLEPALVESPYAGNIHRNITYARLLNSWALNNGFAPFSSHLYYTQPLILDDENEEDRELGIRAGLDIGKLFDNTIVGLDFGVSRGMEYGIEEALKRRRKIIEINLFGDNFDPNISDETFKWYLKKQHGYTNHDFKRRGWTDSLNGRGYPYFNND